MQTSDIAVLTSYLAPYFIYMECEKIKQKNSDQPIIWCKTHIHVYFICILYVWERLCSNELYIGLLQAGLSALEISFNNHN